MRRHRGRRQRRDPGAPAPGSTHSPDPSFAAAVPAQARRKLEQLSRQIEERLALVLAGEVDDPHVSALTLLGVEPEPGSGNMVVVLALPAGAGGEEAMLVARRLDLLRSFFRAEIAGAIHRKRAPNLVFRVVPAPRGRSDDDAEA